MFVFANTVRFSEVADFRRRPGFHIQPYWLHAGRAPEERQRLTATHETPWDRAAILFTPLELRREDFPATVDRSEPDDSSLGDVVASQAEVAGGARVPDRVTLTWGGEAKVKNLQRDTSEESYLYGGLRLAVKGRVAPGPLLAARYRGGRDDARSRNCPRSHPGLWR